MHRDKIDENILTLLRNDARESFVDIGKKLKLSESAVRRRVKNLINEGIIKKFTIDVEESNKTSAVVLITVHSTTDTSKISSQLMNISSIKTIYEITGQYDIIVIINAKNIIEINNCIDSLRKISGISDTNTVIILKTIL
ncbi:MAG: Lrp/AsnC family transcriptional regulator [Nitrosopumilaceae archaeon]|nr:Lrp/AsnC family transcriptional regulator [Nitrosopumilaceae archaeon]